MAIQKVRRGVFISTSTFTKDAKTFGEESNALQLLDGVNFIKKILELPEDKQTALINSAFEGDYKTPSCASCGIKMKERTGTNGSFWGCAAFPKCKNTLKIKQVNSQA